MAQHNVSPVREQIRSEILAALANGAAMSASDLYAHCPSATESTEIARIAHDMRRTGKLETGEQVVHALGMRVNTYKLPTAEDPRIAAAKPIKVERKIPRTIKPPKPAPDHPFKVRIVAQEAHDGAPRVTRPLPMHLTTSAPQMAAESINHYIEDHIMSEDPIHYADPEPFALEPKEPEAEEDVDSDLVSALLELAHQEVEADIADDLLAKMVPLPVADDDMDKPKEQAHKKVCKCLRINSLPPLPKGYIYGGIKVWIESEHDVGRLTIATHDEGDGVFASIKASGRLSFDPGDLVTIGQVADALIRLHESMGEENA